MRSVRAATIVAATATGWLFSVASWGDPLPGEVLKFQQKPMVATSVGPVGGPVYFGHDELSTMFGVAPTPTAPPYQGRFMADDFADKFDTPVLHVKWWGSYMGQEHFVGSGVKQFYIGFESDVPASTSGLPFSHPGQPLLQQYVTKGPLAPSSGTFTETLVRGPDPILGEALYQYNSELACPFNEKRDTVYWLKIVAMVNQAQDGPIQWGWHDRDYTVGDPFASTAPAVVPGEHIDGFVGGGGGIDPAPVLHFQDDAVQGTIITQFIGQCQANTDQSGYEPTHYLPGIDGPDPIGQFSKDLAFELYTVPEPGTLGLIGVAVMTLNLRRRR
jgi:hypothetical protein